MSTLAIIFQSVIVLLLFLCWVTLCLRNTPVPPCVESVEPEWSAERDEWCRALRNTHQESARAYAKEIERLFREKETLMNIIHRQQAANANAASESVSLPKQQMDNLASYLEQTAKATEKLSVRMQGLATHVRESGQ